MNNQDLEEMKSPSRIEKDNILLRKLVKRVLLLELNEDAARNLSSIKEDIIETLATMDRRMVMGGFSKPEVQEQVALKAAERRAAFLKEHGPKLRAAAASGKTHWQIAKDLNEAGVPTPMGGEWKAGSVRHQLANLPET